MASEPRKHHYVPRFLIKRFADERGKVCAYDRVTGKHHKKQNPKRLLVQHDLYRVESKRPGEENKLEDILALGEAQWAPLLNSVVRTGVVEPDQIFGLAEFLTFQIVRTLGNRARLRAITDYSTTAEMIIEQRARREAGEIDDDEWAEIERDIADIEDGKFWLTEPDSNLPAMQMDSLGEYHAALTDGWNYLIVSVTRPGFVLADEPIAFLGDWDGTSATNTAIRTAEEIWMPLDPRHALVLARNPKLSRHIFDLSDDHVRKINQRLVLGSFQWTVYRPGTDPLKGMDIPSQPPRMFVDEVFMPARGDGAGETLWQVDRVHPHVEGEQLLSGRRVVQFPQRDHNFIEKGKPWIPDRARPD